MLFIFFIQKISHKFNLNQKLTGNLITLKILKLGLLFTVFNLSSLVKLFRTSEAKIIGIKSKTNALMFQSFE
jgi:hypothetical protein